MKKCKVDLTTFYRIFSFDNTDYVHLLEIDSGCYSSGTASVRASILSKNIRVDSVDRLPASSFIRITLFLLRKSCAKVVRTNTPAKIQIFRNLLSQSFSYKLLEEMYTFFDDSILKITNKNILRKAIYGNNHQY